MKNSNETLKIVGSLILGAATGAALGILFAPNKGSKTRNNIVGSAKKMTKDLKKKIKNEGNHLKSKTEDLENHFEDKLSYLKEGIPKKVEDVKHTI